MWCHVIGYVVPDILQVYRAFIFRIKELLEEESAMHLWNVGNYTSNECHIPEELRSWHGESMNWLDGTALTPLS